MSLEEALLARPVLPADAPESEKDKALVEQAKTIRELEFVVKGYENNLGEPLRKVKEDVENEWSGKLEKEVKAREEKTAWADELVRQLEKERRIRMRLEEERQALAAFVQKFDSLSIGGGLGVLPPPPSKLRQPLAAGAAVFGERQRSRESRSLAPVMEVDSPMRPVVSPSLSSEPSLLDERWDAVEDVSFEVPGPESGKVESLRRDRVKGVLGMKENLPV